MLAIKELHFFDGGSSTLAHKLEKTTSIHLCNLLVMTEFSFEAVTVTHLV